MIAIQGHDLTATYVAEPVFEKIDFTIRMGEKVGLVGANGAGKTTLFRGLTGELSFDQGHVSIGQNLTLGYLEQHMLFAAGTTLIEAVMSIFQDIFMLWDEIHDLTLRMGECEGEALEALMAEYVHKVEDFEAMDGYSAESRARGIVRGLGFSEEDEEREVASLSGGEKTRLMLARLLVREPDILLLDEPTNHLDIQAVEWLEAFLKKYKGALFIISHDRYFLDEIADRIFAMAHGSLKAYNGNYSQYLRQKKEEEASQHRAYVKQQEMIAKEKAYIERNRAGVHAKQARGRETRLGKVERLQDVASQRSMRLDFQSFTPSAEIVLRVENLGKRYGTKTIFEHASMELRRGQKAGLIGPNGIGKSTFLKIIADQIPAYQGRFELGKRVRMAYYDQEQAQLKEDWSVFDHVIRSSKLLKSEAQDVLARMLFFEDDLDKPVRLLSGGERGRLGLLMTLLKKPNFILMDEPTNHLDIPSKEIVEEYLQSYDGSLLIVSHDRFFLNAICDHTYVLQAEGLKHYLGNYAYYKEKEADLARKQAEKSPARPEPIRKKKLRTDRERARKRNKLERRLDQTESEISVLEDELDRLASRLHEDHLSLETYASIGQEMQKLEQSIDERMDTWAEIALSLEEGAE